MNEERPLEQVIQSWRPRRLSLLGIELRRLRLVKGWTLVELARESKVDKSTISRLETGATRTAHEGNLRALALSLGADPDEFVQLGQWPATPQPAIAPGAVQSANDNFELAAWERDGSAPFVERRSNDQLTELEVVELVERYRAARLLGKLLPQATNGSRSEEYWECLKSST